jgi:gas vesicle protein
MSGASLLGVGVGLLVGAAAGLMFAPMRGGQMRASLRSRADQAWQHGMMLLEEGRHALRTTSAATSSTSPSVSTTEAPGTPLTATLGEIAQIHSGSAADIFEAQS